MIVANMADGNATGKHFVSCLPCSKQGRTSKAEKYCIQCWEYLCSNCVTLHNSFSALCGHTLVGNSGGNEKASLPSVPTETCKSHAAKLIDYYCERHDVVGCSVCINKNHGSCYPHYIPDHVRNNPSATEASSINNSLSKALQNLKVLKERQQHTRDELKEAKEKCTRGIRHNKEELLQIIDRLENACIKELNEKFVDIDAKVQKQMNEIEDSLAELTQRKTEIESLQRNSSQIFVSVKLCAKSIGETEKRIAEYMKAPKEVLSFDQSSEIFDFLANKSGLGSVQTLQRERMHIFGSFFKTKL
ncbi:E3 ubiquitin-protein ligase TRIM33-like [Mercenaria mercenaria]|uniref:E3 ubiquitin-protein ligase TRIM33-like n=1 Tax=Mercenaria mercenaria TaxID=6596 RepID=UPI001E1E1E8D|nr:E3 ubiquitin-protein ligase TRIM33-like [Mercenaria mercenaria]